MSESLNQFENKIVINVSSENFEAIKVESFEIEENEEPSIIKMYKQRSGKDQGVQKRRERKSQSNGEQTYAHTIKILQCKVTRLQVENRRLQDVIRASRCINRMSQKAQSVFEAFNLLHKKAGLDLSTYNSNLPVSPPRTLMVKPNVILSTTMKSDGQNDIDQKSLIVRKDIFEDKAINPFENGVQSSVDTYKLQCDLITNQATELANSRTQDPPESLNANRQNCSQISPNVTELISDCPVHSTWGQPIVTKKGMVLDCVDLNGILVLKESLEKCNTTKASKLTIDLMSIFFTPDEMADSSLTGKPSNIHKSRTPDQVRRKEPLDPVRTKALFAYFKDKFPGTNDQAIKNALKSKLKYEAQEKYGVGFTMPKQSVQERSAELTNRDDRYEENREIFYPPTGMQDMTKTECFILSNNPMM